MVSNQISPGYLASHPLSPSMGQSLQNNNEPSFKGVEDLR